MVSTKNVTALAAPRFEHEPRRMSRNAMRREADARVTSRAETARLTQLAVRRETLARYAILLGKGDKTRMKIAVIGSANVGGALGTRWARNGHAVVFGVRNTASADMKTLLSAAGPNARAASIGEAGNASEVIVLATPWAVAQVALSAAGDLTAKIVIDATNPLVPGLQGLSVGTTTSAGEQIAAWFPGARVVKTFNTVGNNVMENSAFPDGAVAMFYCGDDVAAKQVAASLAAELGFEPLDAGPLSQCRVLEPFAMLWISIALKYGYGREIAFRFLRRSR